VRYYGEVVLVASVAECPVGTYEAFSPPQTPTALRTVTEVYDIYPTSKKEQTGRKAKGRKTK